MSRRVLVTALFLCFFVPVAAEETFPLPPELQPDVDFWVSVFTEIDSDSGILHDNRHLGVVYSRIEVPERLSRAERQRRIDPERDRIRAALAVLASGKRDGLTEEQARLLALWPEGVSNDVLAGARDRIRFQRGIADRFREGLARSGRWRAYVEREFEALGVPIELAALPHVESSYNPDARSHVGASGIWQFTRSTGRRFLRVDHVLDERNDPYAATRAAGQLLAYNHSITGNWPTAITAYNHGLAGIRRAMREHGDTAYVDILRRYDGRTFGFASRNFYVAFLAALEVDRNADRYFPGLVREPPESWATARLEDYVSAEALQRGLSLSAAELRRANPSLQPTVWQGSKLLPRGFELRVPPARVNGSLESLLAALPADDWADEQLPDLFHTIARGDTLSQIAEEYDTSVSTLVALNGLDSRHRIRAGQQLRLPAAGPAPPPAAPVAAEVEADVVASVASPPVEADIDEPEPAALSDAPAVDEDVATTTTELLSDPSDYTVAANDTIEVQPLETLGHFADWLGLRTQRLRDLNGFAFRTPVEVGQRIRLDFGTVDRATFEARRIAYHRTQQDRYFREHVITGVREHEIRSGESVWVLSLREYDVPLWLFRQYNPELDLHNVRPGTVVRFPLLVPGDRS